MKGSYPYRSRHLKLSASDSPDYSMNRRNLHSIKPRLQIRQDKSDTYHSLAVFHYQKCLTPLEASSDYHNYSSNVQDNRDTYKNYSLPHILHKSAHIYPILQTGAYRCFCYKQSLTKK